MGALESHQLSKFSTNHNGALPGCAVHFDWLKFLHYVTWFKSLLKLGWWIFALNTGLFLIQTLKPYELYETISPWSTIENQLKRFCSESTAKLLPPPGTGATKLRWVSSKNVLVPFYEINYKMSTIIYGKMVRFQN